MPKGPAYMLPTRSVFFLGEIIYLTLIECDADDNSKGHSGLR